MKPSRTGLAGRLLVHCLGLCSLLACSPSGIIVPPPELIEGGSVIFAIGSQARGFELIASPFDSSRFLARSIDPDEALQVTAFVYAQSLSAMGLEPGVVPQVAPEMCGARALPAQDALHQVSRADGETSQWRSLETLPAELQALRIGGPCPCDAFDVVARPASPPMLAWFDRPDGVLLLDEERGFWTLQGDDLEMIQTATLAPAGTLEGVADGENGQIWVSVDGVIWRGSPTGGFEAQATVSNDVVRGLASGPGPNGFEVYAATTGGNLLQVAPPEPRVLVRALRAPSNPGQLGRVEWLGPGEVVAAEHGTFDILWVKDGVETRRIQLPGPSGGARRLRFIPQVGLLVLTTTTRVLRIDGPNIDDFADAPALPNARSMTIYKQGFVYVGDTGFIQQFVPGFGFCPTQYVEGQAPIFGLSQLQDRVAVYTLNPSGRGAGIVLLQPRPLMP